MKGLYALVALAAAAAITYYVMSDSSRGVTPVGPGGTQPGVPPTPGFTPISPEAERLDYGGHSYYVWEMANADGTMGWHWVVQFDDVSVAEGHIQTTGLDGAAEAGVAARAWIDTKYVP